MSTSLRKKSKFRFLLLPAFCLLMLSYFAYHAIEGEYGLASHARMTARLAEIEHELAEVGAVRQRYEQYVALMRPESIDADMVDERARQALNLVHRNDVVIFLDHGASRPATGSLAQVR